MYFTQDIADRINSLIKSKGIKKKDLLSYCSLNVNAISEFSKGKELSCISFAKIADYLDCSVDYLLGRTSNSDSLSPFPEIKTAAGDEQRQRLNDNYDRMNEKGQQTLLSFSGYLIQQPENLTEGGEDNQNVS